MSEQDSTPNDEQSAAETSGDEQQSTAAEEQAAKAENLGDAGKKAIDAMKAERNEYREAFKSLRSEFEAFKAKTEGREAEHQKALDEQRIKDEALSAANQRILKAELRAAAKGKLSDPSDAFRFPEEIDLSSFEVGEDGSVDTAALEAAVDNLISKKPYLAVQDGQRFQGVADAGARNGAAPSIPEQIAQAERNGDWRTAAALKAGQLLDIPTNQ